MAKRKRGVAKVVKGAKEENAVVIPAKTVRSDEPPRKRVKWINRQRVLVFASRGITHRSRHLLLNFRTMLPHSKPDSKMEKKDSLTVINEICEMKNCNKCIFLEQRKGLDLYMWISNVPDGPSVKFYVENIHTMEELKMTGNCLKGSRPILSFDRNFETNPHYALLRELFVQVFGVPNSHPKSQPFVDHVLSFSILDKRIWFRNYQIVEENGSLVEIGPRFVLNPIKIFKGSFGGETLWDNTNYVTPNMHRRLVKKEAASKFLDRREAKLSAELRKPGVSYKLDPLHDVFKNPDTEVVEEDTDILEVDKYATQREARKKKKLQIKMKEKENKSKKRHVVIKK